MPKVIKASASEDYKLSLAFDDGVAGEIDLSDFVQLGIFTKLRDDKALFMRPSIIDNGLGISREKDRLDIDAQACYEDILSLRQK